MVPLQFSHFQALLLFALIISLAFGTLGRRRPLERLKYAAWSFAMFLLVGIALGWLLARKEFWGKTLLDGIIYLPLVLPPVLDTRNDQGA